MRIDVLDLDFQGVPLVIAAFLVRGPEGAVLVECGPRSTLETLLVRLEEQGVAPEEVQQVLLTHIHLDHAGAAGWWARLGATVYVHPVGAPHLVDPSKLLRSAQRIYGDRMDELWGETLSAPAGRVVAVGDGEPVRAGGLTFLPLETPGHAGHHHVWRLDGVAFSGDAAGIRRPHSAWIDLPAPPPEFDLEAWRASLARLRAAAPEALYRTHFGPAGEVAAELDRFEELMVEAAELVKGFVAEGLERDAMVERYNAWMLERAVAAGVDETEARGYELANPRIMSVDGIARYWRKR